MTRMVKDNGAAVGKLFNQIRDQRDEARAEVERLRGEVAALREELTYTLQIAIRRGENLGYVEADTDWIARWEELSGEPW